MLAAKAYLVLFYLVFRVSEQAGRGKKYQHITVVVQFHITLVIVKSEDTMCHVKKEDTCAGYYKGEGPRDE